MLPTHLHIHHTHMCTHIWTINAHRHIHTTPPQGGVQVSGEEITSLLAKRLREKSYSSELSFASSLVFTPKHDGKMVAVLITRPERRPFLGDSCPWCRLDYALPSGWPSQDTPPSMGLFSWGFCGDLWALCSGTFCFWILSMTHKSLRRMTKPNYTIRSENTTAACSASALANEPHFSLWQWLPCRLPGY